MLTWTKERPAREGWYWQRCGEQGPYILQVWNDEGALVIIDAYGEVDRPVDDYDNPAVEWAGPIPEPIDTTA
jgi:hypothetical protein